MPMRQTNDDVQAPGNSKSARLNYTVEDEDEGESTIDQKRSTLMPMHSGMQFHNGANKIQHSNFNLEELCLMVENMQETGKPAPLSKTSEALSAKEVNDIRQRMKQKFLKSKKLPANTPQRFGETMRIGFSRRQDMQTKPLVIMMFSEILGQFEARYKPKPKPPASSMALQAQETEQEMIIYKTYVRRNVLKFLDDLLGKC